MTARSAPSAAEFLEAEGRRISEMDHGQYMDFAERYADFMVEFEKKGGDLSLCERFPLSRAGKFIDL